MGELASAIVTADKWDIQQGTASFHADWRTYRIAVCARWCAPILSGVMVRPHVNRVDRFVVGHASGYAHRCIEATRPRFAYPALLAPGHCPKPAGPEGWVTTIRRVECLPITDWDAR
jgi:hypothetical protein